MPEFLNLTHACCERWEHDKNHLALIYEHADSSVERYTYAELDDSASRFAYVLKACGLQRDERVAVLRLDQLYLGHHRRARERLATASLTARRAAQSGMCVGRISSPG